jgi:hypothetical protein
MSSEALLSVAIIVQAGGLAWLSWRAARLFQHIGKALRTQGEINQQVFTLITEHLRNAHKLPVPSTLREDGYV